MSDTVHRYRTHLQWAGSTSVGYDHYDRTHRVWPIDDAGRPVQPDGGDGLLMSSDPAFGGRSTLHNPEQLLVMAASSCHMLSFLAVAARKRFDVVSYVDEAEAEMPEGDRPVRISTIVLHPTIVFGTSVDQSITDEVVDRLHETAHRLCFIASSLGGEVLVDGTYTIAESAS